MVVLITDLMNEILEAGILLVVLARIELQLLPWLLLMLPFVFFFALGFRRLARRVTRSGFRAMANVNALIKEAVSGISVAKNFRQEAAIYGEFGEVNRRSYRINVRRGLVLSLVFPDFERAGRPRHSHPGLRRRPSRLPPGPSPSAPGTCSSARSTASGFRC